ncbi:MAG TPA: sulfite exporter TauE/SafE family protein [Methylophilaceae bacterium]|nr:sulfite exporter TauE/SafE family protein [Methylophilaceae bacterium]
MLEYSLTAALLVGLLGGGHCAGMCGPIVGAVTVTMPGNRPRLDLVLVYNLGRILTYTLAGALAGAIGASSYFLDHILPVQQLLYGLASLMLIVLGLYLAGIWHGVTAIEGIGRHLWRYLQPLSGKLLPVRHLPQALGLGLVWGWLPCGLVYSVLVAAIATGDPLKGASLMLAFGLGTLPALMAMGMAAVRLKRWLQDLWVRRISGLTVLAFGVVGLVRLWQ